MPHRLRELGCSLVARDKAIVGTIIFLIALNVTLRNIKVYMQILNDILLWCLRHASSLGQ